MTGGTAVLLKTGYPNYGSETKFPLHLYLYYKIVSQNKATAVTTMSLGMYFVCPDKWYVGPWSDYGSYLGTTANTFSKSVPSNFSGTLWLAENVTFNVQHDAQGKGTAKIEWKWGVDSSYGQFESPSGAYSVSLPDIPRTSSVSVGGAVNAGSALAISIGRTSTSFTHTLRYAFGSASGTIATGVGTGYNWTVPYDLLWQIPSETSGVGTIYCDTYYGGTLIGTSSCGFTVNAPNNSTTKPSASMMLSPSGSVPAAFSGMYIQGKTAVKADFTAEPKYGTSIKSYALAVNGKTTSGDPSTSAVLSASGETTVTGTVTDARGFSRVLTEKITVQSYGAPSVVPGAGQKSVICERADANGISSPSGTYLRIVANRKYSSVAGANACTLRYRFKQSSASSYGAWVTLLAAGSSGDGYSGALSGIVSSVTTSYDVQIGVVDTMGTEAAITFHIPTDEVAFHIREGGRGAAFFGYSEKDGELSLSGKKITGVGAPTEAGDALPKGYTVPISEGGTGATSRLGAAKALTNQAVSSPGFVVGLTSGWATFGYTTIAQLRTALGINDYVTAQGTSGEWYYRKWNSGRAECYWYGWITPSVSASAGKLLNKVYMYAKSYPFTFAATPTAVAGVTHDNGYGFVTRLNIDKDKVSVLWEGGTNNASAGLSIHVTGKWK